MREGTVKVTNRLGLHARAAAQLVRLSAAYASRITLFEPSKNATADAKSILSILTLSASIGTTLIVKVEGEDEKAALDAVTQLFLNGFNEL